MPRLLALSLVALVACSHAVRTSPQEAVPRESSRPNVLVIMTDDQGFGDFSGKGSPVFETPHLDSLARDGVSMETFYVSPVCSPTRASLMTGRYNQRTRVVDTWIGRSMMEPEEVTIAELLREAGYATGIFGKWHLGDCYPMRPIDQGFDEALVHRGGGLAQPSEPRENARRYTDPILIHNGEEVQTRGYCTDVYTDALIAHVEKSHREGRPWLAFLTTNAPHGPFHDVPEDLRRHFAQKNLDAIMKRPGKGAKLAKRQDRLARIAAMVANTDANVGRLLETLERMGISGDTLVIYLNDNGPNSRRDVGPFRGMKSEVFEGGIRSPLWMRWPGRLPAGGTSPVVSAHIDVMPTILEACGVAVPGALRLDGRSLLPLFSESPPAWPERDLVIQAHRGTAVLPYRHFMLRRGRWKLVRPSGFSGEAPAGEPRFELYDLVKDPGESRDLAAEEPRLVAALRGAYDRWYADVSTTRPDNFAPPPIVVGTPHEPRTVLTRQDWIGPTWNEDALGHWIIEVAGAGAFDLRCEVSPRSFAERLVLELDGRIVWAGETEAGADALEIRGVRLPDGRHRVGVVLSEGTQRRSVRHLTLRRSR